MVNTLHWRDSSPAVLNFKRVSVHDEEGSGGL